VKDDASARALGDRFRAAAVEVLNPAEQVYTFTFASAADAVASVQPLLCDPAVLWASIALEKTGNDEWCPGPP
jgi:hypothetical protein